MASEIYIAVKEERLNNIERILSQISNDLQNQKDISNSPLPNYLTTEQVMGYLSVSRRTVDNLKASGKLPYTKVKGLLRFLLTDVSGFMEQYKVGRS